MTKIKNRCEHREMFGTIAVRTGHDRARPPRKFFLHLFVFEKSPQMARCIGRPGYREHLNAILNSTKSKNSGDRRAL